MRWIAAHDGRRPTDLSSLRNLYRQNLKNLEADIGDAIALDNESNLLLATHTLEGIELRKFSPNGSIGYDSVVNTCRDTSLSVSALAVDKSGRAWLAGNMSQACLTTTSHAWRSHVGSDSGEHGFVVLLDTSQASRTAPIYATYLFEIAHHVSGIRVDAMGNAFVCGTIKSNAFQTSFPLEKRILLRQGAPAVVTNGFVAVLNPSGSQMLSSTLLEGAKLNALALSADRTAYVTGAGSGLFIAALSEGATKMRYLMQLDHRDNAEGRAVSVMPDGNTVVAQGVIEDAVSVRKPPQRGVVVVARPCQNRPPSAYLMPADEEANSTEIADQPTLDSFSAIFASAPLGLRSRPVQARESCSGR